MDRKTKIRDVYHIDYKIEDVKYPLQVWHKELINKCYDELEVSDVARMLRQRLFVDMGVDKAMDFLRNDCFSGEQYEGELLEWLYKTDAQFLKKHKDEIIIVLNTAKQSVQAHEWLYDGEQREFTELVEHFENKMKEL